MRSFVPFQTRQRESRAGAILVVGIFSCVALLFGLIAALTGWTGLIILTTIVVPTLILVADYRKGILMAILLLPYANSPLIPRIGSLSPENVLSLGICFVFMTRALLMQTAGRKVAFPLDRELLLYYLAPLTVAVIIGCTHVREIPQTYLLLNHVIDFSITTYVVGFYVKQMLLITIVLATASAVQESRKSNGFQYTLILSGFIFVVAMVALITIAGISIADTMRERNLFHILGRHNNEAGAMLLGVFAPVLFMRELTRNSRLKTLLLGVLCVLIVGLLLTGSRGAVLAMAVLVSWYLWRYRRGRTFLLILTLLMIGVAFAPDAVRDRLATGLDDKPSAGVADVGVTRNDGLTAGRVFMYKQLAPEVLRSPLFGRGLSSTQWSSAVKSGIYSANHPHNLYLEILMDGGLMLAACMFLFYRYAWRKFMQIGNDERYPLELRGFCLGGAGGLIAMLIYGTGNGHWYPAPEQIFFWVSLGIAIGAARWVTDSSALGSKPSPISSPSGIIPGPQLSGTTSRILAQ